MIMQAGRRVGVSDGFQVFSPSLFRVGVSSCCKQAKWGEDVLLAPIPSGPNMTLED